MIHFGRRREAACVVAAAGVLVLGGCAQVVDGRGSGPPGTVPSAAPSGSRSARSSPIPVPQQWQHRTDKPTGIRFALPGTADVTRQPSQVSDGTPAEKRIYQLALGSDDNKVELSVGVISGTDQPVTFAGVDLHAIPAALIRQFRAVGATDFQILEEHPATVAGHRALDFRVSFTSLSATPKKALWFIRVINDGQALVMVQTIAFRPAGQDAVAEPELRQLHARVVAGIRL